MKLVNRKTRKAIEKSVRKALKKHGPALVAAIAGSLISSIATLAGTEAAESKKSNLAELVDRAKGTVAGRDPVKTRSRRARQASARRQSPDAEGTQSQPAQVHTSSAS